MRVTPGRWGRVVPAEACGDCNEQRGLGRVGDVKAVVIDRALAVGQHGDMCLEPHAVRHRLGRAGIWRLFAWHSTHGYAPVQHRLVGVVVARVHVRRRQSGKNQCLPCRDGGISERTRESRVEAQHPRPIGREAHRDHVRRMTRDDLAREPDVAGSVLNVRNRVAEVERAAILVPEVPVVEGDDEITERQVRLRERTHQPFRDTIGLDEPLHPDFSSTDWNHGVGYGIPFNKVGSDTPRRSVSFQYAGQSDPGKYPIPKHPKIEGASDRHLLMWDTDACKLYELFNARKVETPAELLRGLGEVLRNPRLPFILVLNFCNYACTFTVQGLTAVGSGSAEFAAKIRKEYDMWGKVVRDARIKLD